MPPRTRPRDRVPTRVETPTSREAETARKSSSNWERAALEVQKRGAPESGRLVQSLLCTGEETSPPLENATSGNLIADSPESQ
ncbi:hypothetical protein NDU88_004154 [Pleurodeles waltl]|uniref:Uncharacterized protein n=1 Tax=Pleurodeles waltl TaxID=8319 RepID=A0AAV7UEW1_PLEWA|nr:hypothetical protein NDU88_004154 [Pleurodeles waltl]